MIASRRQNALGATLIEMLAYIVIMGIVLNICGTTFVQTTRLASLTTTYAMRQQAEGAFAEDFVRAVHGASRVLPNAGAAVTREDQVVLDAPDGPIVVGVAGKFPAIWKLECENGVWRVRSIRSYPFTARLRFEFDTAEPAAARRVKLHLDGPPRKDADDAANPRVLVAAFRVTGVQP